MAKFTAKQANSCKFTRCESFKVDRIHSYWVISVLDENGCMYEWMNSDLPESANITAIKASAKSTILTLDIKEPVAAISHDVIDQIIVDTID